jgi:hypothetical protein
MSSEPPSPYKSRLFNFLNRQSIRWQDRVGQAWRNAKVAAVWGVQVLLYPIYLLVQTARFGGYQLQQAIGRTWQQLLPSRSSPSPLPEIPPPVDTPIQRVLNALNTSDIGHKLPIPCPTPPEFQLSRQVIVGLASLLTNRSLVLVTTENQILDVLTPDEEQKLRQRLIWEIAVYWHHWRCWQEAHRQFSGRVPLREQSHLLPPIRWFWGVMAWMQTSPVAIAIDLFGESALVANITAELTTTALTPTSTTYSLELFEEQLAFLDRQIAQWEANLVLPGTQEGWQRAKEFLHQLREKIPGGMFFHDSAASPQTPETDDMKIKSLIWAAIDYFFGRKRHKKTLSGTPVPNFPDRVPPATRNIYDSLPPDLRFDEEDPWLSWEELFPDPPTAPTSTSQPKQSPAASPKKNRSVVAVPSRTELAGKPSPVELSGRSPLIELPGETQIQPALPGKSSIPFWQAIGRTIKSFLGLPIKDAKTLTTRQRGSKSIAKTAKITPLATNATGKLAQSAASDTAIEHTPDWVETQATPVGYIKHPLERILGWLDRAMLWLEETAIKIWQWVQQQRNK